MTDRDRSYSIEDHPHLSGSQTQELYTAFRNEVLALDPCISEEFLKQYVAYKAETNVVDISPQAKRLKVFVNMPFNSVHDPEGRCRNVAGIGRHGNGEVEAILSRLEDIPYIIGLVRQALERQLGHGGEA